MKHAHKKNHWIGSFLYPQISIYEEEKDLILSLKYFKYTNKLIK